MEINLASPHLNGGGVRAERTETQKLPFDRKTKVGNFILNRLGARDMALRKKEKGRADPSFC